MKLRDPATLIALGLLALAGCAATPPKDSFYRLPATVASATVKVADGPIIYIPPFVADGLHGERALVYAHDDGTTLEQYTYHYWVDSPRLLLQQALAARLRGAHRVVTAPSADASYTLRGHIAKFERQGTGKGAKAEVSLEFELLPADTDVAQFARVYQRSVPLADDAMSSCAGALGQAAQDLQAGLVADLEVYWGH